MSEAREKETRLAEEAAIENAGRVDDALSGAILCQMRVVGPKTLHEILAETDQALSGPVCKAHLGPPGRPFRATYTPPSSGVARVMRALTLPKATPIAENEPHVEKSPVSAPATKSRLLITKTRGLLRACHEKWPPYPRTAPQRERSCDKTADNQILRPCVGEVHCKAFVPRADFVASKTCCGPRSANFAANPAGFLENATLCEPRAVPWSAVFVAGAGFFSVRPLPAACPPPPPWTKHSWTLASIKQGFVSPPVQRQNKKIPDLTLMCRCHGSPCVITRSPKHSEKIE